MVDLRNNEDDRPYRGVNRAQYTPPGQREEYDYDDTMTTQAYYRERLRNVTEQRWFPLAAVTLGVVLFGSLIAFAYHQGADTTANSTTPLIQAENGAFKEKPQNPGGMDVPFQDAVVFDQLDKSAQNQTATQTAQNGQVENLLPPPEQPVDATPAATPAKTTQNAPETAPPSAPQNSADKGVVAGVADTDSVADKIAATEANLKTKTTIPDTSAAEQETVAAATKATKATNTAAAATPSAASAQTTTSTVKTDTEQTATAAPSAVVTAKTIPTKATAKAASAKTTAVATATSPAKLNTVAPAAPQLAAVSTTGSAKVQLGAFKDEAAAKAAWTSLQKQYSPHLNGVTPNYARADLGAKGVFYRVQGVNLSKTQATDICKAINATKPGACITPQ